MMFGGGAGRGGGGGGIDTNETLSRTSSMMMPPPATVVGAGGDVEEFPRRDERVPQWSHQETRDFIAIRGELERDFTVAKRNKSLWEVVSAKMKKIGYRRTPDQCKCKWKNLVSRYKGKETSDRDNSRSCPFFDELHALFTERAKNTPHTPFEPEPSSGPSRKRVKRADSFHSLEDVSEDVSEDEYDSDENQNRTTKATKTKPEREKRPHTSNPTPRPSDAIREVLREFFEQQQVIDTQWKELVEKRAYERQVYDQEWRQSMERLERERMRMEESWRENEERRRVREEGRAERRDALLTELLGKLIREQ